MIEAHLYKSSRCEIACAGVAAGKGLGAEGREGRVPDPGIADKIRRAVAEMRSAIFNPSYSDFYSKGQRNALAFSARFDCFKERTNNMKKTIFTGAATAIVTPFKNGEVDYEQFGRLIEWQIAEGIDAIVACGTTGEGSTLTDEEHREVIRYAVEKVAGRVPVIAGTGSNDTAYAIDLTKFACEAGADAMLLVTPYYNKATQKGLIKSFEAVADISTKPIILYNVPSRTGCNLLPASAAALADHPNIVAIKEACGNISQIAELASLVRGKMDIYSGNDDQIVPVLSLGGKGVISVLSNIMPKATSQMCHKFFAGDVAGSAEMQLNLLNLINALFCEVNPIPVKAAVSAMGYGENSLRLPLTPMEAQNEAKLLALMKEQNLI